MADETTPEQENKDAAASITVLEEINIPESVPEQEPEAEEAETEAEQDEEQDELSDADETEADEDDVEEEDASDDDASTGEAEEDTEEEVDDEDDEGLSLEELLEGDDDADSKPKRKKVPFHKRIGQLTAARRAAEARADKAEQAFEAQSQRIDALEKRLTEGVDSGNSGDSEQSNELKAPSPDDFKFGEFDPEYTKALTEHAAEVAASKVRKEFEDDRKKVADEQKAQEIAEKFNERRDAGREAYDDFDEVVIQAGDQGEYPLSEDVVMMVLDSPVGEKVLYDIASNLKLARQIDEMDTTAKARAFGRLEARHSASTATPKQKPRKATKAPPPPKKRARASTSRNKLDPKTASIKDLETKFNKDGRI